MVEEPDHTTAGGSRFSRWFSIPQGPSGGSHPGSREHSRRSSINEEFSHYLTGMLAHDHARVRLQFVLFTPVMFRTFWRLCLLKVGTSIDLLHVLGIYLYKEPLLIYYRMESLHEHDFLICNIADDPVSAFADLVSDLVSGQKSPIIPSPPPGGEPLTASMIENKQHLFDLLTNSGGGIPNNTQHLTSRMGASQPPNG